MKLNKMIITRKSVRPPQCPRDSLYLLRSAVLALLLVGLPTGFGAVTARAAEPLKWSVTPYIWATETTVDLTADGTPIGGGTVTFSDLMDATDASFQIHVEAGRSRWSGFIDFTYLDTFDDEDFGGVKIETDSEQWLIDLAVAFWPGGEEKGLSFYGGLRYTDLDDEYEFKMMGSSIGTLRSQRDFTDLLLGVRYRFTMGKHWSLWTRGDVSFGDSEGTFQLEGFFRYAVGKRRTNGILFGYRYKEAEFEEGGLVEDYQYKGPAAAFNFRF